MIENRAITQQVREQQNGRTIGTPGRLAILAWSMLLILLVPPERFLLAGAFCLALNSLLYPQAIKRLFRWRWLLFIVLLIMPSILWATADDWQMGLVSGLQMAVRAMVVLLAVDGFASSVAISEVAGLFEKIGLPGLGFSMGVAVNLLPALRHSSQCAWHSLRMRGGLRRRWRRGLQLLLVTIVANALRQAEEIALAAELRAFAPDHSRTLPIKRGRADWAITILLFASGILVVIP